MEGPKYMLHLKVIYKIHKLKSYSDNLKSTKRVTVRMSHTHLDASSPLGDLQGRRE